MAPYVPGRSSTEQSDVLTYVPRISLSQNERGRASRRSQGFVAAELIIVLVVLAMFPSMFRASLGTARDKAGQAVCAEHLRHLSSAWSLYAYDYAGAVPPVSIKVHDTGRNWDDYASWPTIMQAYIDDPTLQHVSPRATSTALTDNGVLSCPALREGVGSHTPHYGVNHVALRVTDGGWDRLPDMPDPSRTLIFADSRGWYVIGPIWGLEHIRYRHQGGTNAAFADGHVDWLPEQ
jgi:prepilin-type processing-associated H-X9-DG protein